MLRSADAIIAVSEELAREIAIWLPASAGKMEVIPNGVDVRALREALPRVHPRPYIAFVGRLVHEKDMDTLLNAFDQACEENPGIDLLIAGTGRQEKRLCTKAADGAGGERFHFLGGRSYCARCRPYTPSRSVVRGSRWLARDAACAPTELTKPIACLISPHGTSRVL